MPPYSPDSLACRWNCSADLVRAMCDRGDLASFRLGSRLIRIAAAEVERYECQNIESSSTETPSVSLTPTPSEDVFASRLARQIKG